MRDSQQHSQYRHPKHAEAAKLLRMHINVKDVADLLGMARSAVQRVRAIEGITLKDRIVPVADKLAAHTVWVEAPGEHAVWSGKRNHGTPVIRHRGREMSAAAVAYEMRVGRLPVGQAKSECDGHPHCMNPAHILDQDDRQVQRRQLRALMGYGPTADFCEAGHPQDVHGGVEPNLKVYCRACSTERRAANRRGVAAS